MNFCNIHFLDIQMEPWNELLIVNIAIIFWISLKFLEKGIIDFLFLLTSDSPELADDSETAIMIIAAVE
jgi:hypothetical protein